MSIMYTFFFVPINHTTQESPMIFDRRMYEHHTGYNPKSYTHNRRPVELVFIGSFNNPDDAIAFEKQVKGWSRKKKQALINGNWEKLKELSASKGNASEIKQNSN